MKEAGRKSRKTNLSNIGKNLRNINCTKRATPNLKKDELQNNGNCKVVEIEGKCRLISNVETDKKYVVCKDEKHDGSEQICDKSKKCLHYDTNTKEVIGLYIC